MIKFLFAISFFLVMLLLLISGDKVLVKEELSHPAKIVEQVQMGDKIFAGFHKKDDKNDNQEFSLEKMLHSQEWVATFNRGWVEERDFFQSPFFKKFYDKLALYLSDQSISSEEKAKSLWGYFKENNCDSGVSNYLLNVLSSYPVSEFYKDIMNVLVSGGCNENTNVLLLSTLMSTYGSSSELNEEINLLLSDISSQPQGGKILHATLQAIEFISIDKAHLDNRIVNSIDLFGGMLSVTDRNYWRLRMASVDDIEKNIKLALSDKENMSSPVSLAYQLVDNAPLLANIDSSLRISLAKRLVEEEPKITMEALQDPYAEANYMNWLRTYSTLLPNKLEVLVSEAKDNSTDISRRLEIIELARSEAERTGETKLLEMLQQMPELRTQISDFKNNQSHSQTIQNIIEYSLRTLSINPNEFRMD